MGPPVFHINSSLQAQYLMALFVLFFSSAANVRPHTVSLRVWDHQGRLFTHNISLSNQHIGGGKRTIQPINGATSLGKIMVYK